MLTKSQRAAAKSLFISRPGVLPGTRVIVNDVARKSWYDRVCDAMQRTKVKTKEDISEFCDVAGVPD